ncbi:hypothetical protein NC652_002118 [Populus alba x Populus x berolinensis]|uniref:Uncharacterized protein n=1 Tax=Populus alba x Populus x berolinensis TaxID=444605 RepID=A0AAD6RN66_9ROSI|nr:hypothetical protein NC652_002118 [Populus alba x Populus x berolinensis]KAJ7012001.1 hypothetical protein NC653_002173 [Populus alba x Populus x berolinensis]
MLLMEEDSALLLLLSMERIDSRCCCYQKKETPVLCQMDAADGSCRNKSPAIAMAQRRSSCWTVLKLTVGLTEAVVLLLQIQSSFPLF